MGGLGATASTAGLSEQEAEAAAAAASEAVLAAATELTDILETLETVDVGTAQTVTEFVSVLITEEITVDGKVDEKSSEQIASAVQQLARALTADAEVGEVKLVSKNLNLTTEARSAAELATRPVECDTASALPTKISMPSNVLSAIRGLNLDTPISVVLFSSAINLHRGLRDAAASPSMVDAESTNGTQARRIQSSPMVSFSLVQAGKELRVEGAESAINISIPFQRETTTVTLIEDGVNVLAPAPPPCIGSNNGSYERCHAAIECRWWDKQGNGSWASAGCATIAAADGVSYTCSCDHLTDFIVFEFPTTAEELFEDITQAVTVHQITARAFECLRRPSFTTHPVLWGINVGLLVLFGLGLGNAIRRDRKEIAFVEKLMEGRKKDALRRGRMRIAQLLKQNANSTRFAKGVLTGESAAMAPLRRLRMSSRAASMFAGSRPVTTNATEGAPASQGLQRYTRADSLFIPSWKGKDFDALGSAAAAPHRLTVGGKKCDPAVGTPRRVSVIEDEEKAAPMATAASVDAYPSTKVTFAAREGAQSSTEAQMREGKRRDSTTTGSFALARPERRCVRANGDEQCECASGTPQLSAVIIEGGERDHSQESNLHLRDEQDAIRRKHHGEESQGPPLLELLDEVPSEDAGAVAADRSFARRVGDAYHNRMLRARAAMSAKREVVAATKTTCDHDAAVPPSPRLIVSPRQALESMVAADSMSFTADLSELSEISLTTGGRNKKSAVKGKDAKAACDPSSPSSARPREAGSFGKRVSRSFKKAIGLHEESAPMSILSRALGASVDERATTLNQSHLPSRRTSEALAQDYSEHFVQSRIRLVPAGSRRSLSGEQLAQRQPGVLSTILAVHTNKTGFTEDTAAICIQSHARGLQSRKFRKAARVVAATVPKRASRVEADVLGIFGKRDNKGLSMGMLVNRSEGPASDDAEGPASDDAMQPSAGLSRAAVRWRQAKLVADQELLTKRWHKDVNRGYKRLWLFFKDSHTLMAGVIYRGVGGYTRAQTVMVLLVRHEIERWRTPKPLRLANSYRCSRVPHFAACVNDRAIQELARIGDRRPLYVLLGPLCWPTRDQPHQDHRQRRAVRMYLHPYDGCVRMVLHACDLCSYVQMACAQARLLAVRPLQMLCGLAQADAGLASVSCTACTCGQCSWQTLSCADCRRCSKCSARSFLASSFATYRAVSGRG